MFKTSPRTLFYRPSSLIYYLYYYMGQMEKLFRYVATNIKQDYNNNNNDTNDNYNAKV